MGQDNIRPARYRLKYCLKGPLNPKQPTNQQYKTFLTHQYKYTGRAIAPPHPPSIGVALAVAALAKC